MSDFLTRLAERALGATSVQPRLPSRFEAEPELAHVGGEEGVGAGLVPALFPGSGTPTRAGTSPAPTKSPVGTGEQSFHRDAPIPLLPSTAPPLPSWERGPGGEGPSAEGARGSAPEILGAPNSLNAAGAPIPPLPRFRPVSPLTAPPLPSWERGPGGEGRAEGALRPPVVVHQGFPHDISPHAPAPEPTIRVTIGRIEVRAVTPPPPPPAARPTGPRLSLEDYLQKREGRP